MLRLLGIRWRRIAVRRGVNHDGIPPGVFVVAL